MDKSDPLDPKLDKIMVECMHNDVMNAMGAKGKLVYDMTADEQDNLFKTIAFNVKEEGAQSTSKAWLRTG